MVKATIMPLSKAIGGSTGKIMQDKRISAKIICLSLSGMLMILLPINKNDSRKLNKISGITYYCKRDNKAWLF